MASALRAGLRGSGVSIASTSRRKASAASTAAAACMDRRPASRSKTTASGKSSGGNVVLRPMQVSQCLPSAGLNDRDDDDDER